jgi:hypothetical protein
MTGHLFIVDGDLTRIACDALLLPVDETWWVETPAFGRVLGMTEPGPAPGHPDDWPATGMWLCRSGAIATDGSFGEPDIWLGDIGRSSLPDSSHFAERARSFVSGATAVARERLESHASVVRRRPILCVNVLGSGAGGKRSQRGELLRALIPALIESSASSDVDVVLVCYGSTMYAAAQSERRRLTEDDDHRLGWEGLEPALRSHADRLAELARQGRLVLFMGSGISADVGIPAWKPLLASLARELLGFDDEQVARLGELDPRDQAHVIEHSAKPTPFRNALAARMVAGRHGLAHALLASLPCTEAVTTNFDDLFERACDGPGRQLAVIPGGEVARGHRWLLKLHGSLGGDVVFTRFDYLGAESTHAALRGIVQAMLLTRHMLFVGYSLSDEDFHQLVHEVRQAKGVSHTAPGSATGEERAILGTALFPENNPHLPAVWPDLEIVGPSEEGLDFTERVRRLWIMLDWVGMQSASTVAHLADDSFGQMRSDLEAELSDLVNRLISLRDRVQSQSGSAWHELDQFLARFTPGT